MSSVGNKAGVFRSVFRSEYAMRSHKMITKIYSFLILLQLCLLAQFLTKASTWRGSSPFPYLILIVLAISSLLRLFQIDDGPKKWSSQICKLSVLCIFTSAGFLTQELILLELSILPFLLSIFFFWLLYNDNWISTIAVVISYISCYSIFSIYSRLWIIVAITGTFIMIVYTVMLRSIIFASYRTTNETYDNIAKLRNKLKAEITLMETIVNSTLPRNLCRYLNRERAIGEKIEFLVDRDENLDDNTDEDGKEDSCAQEEGHGGSGAAENKQQSATAEMGIEKSHFDNDDRTQALLRDLLDAGVLINPKDSPVSVDTLNRLNRISRQFCIMISFKISVAGNAESFTNMEKISHINAALDILCAKYNIDKVHHCGGVWVGCAGFFDFGDIQPSCSRPTTRHCILCHDTILAATDIMATFDHFNWKVRCAIDCGYVIAGFLVPGEFNMFGQEVRFVMQKVNAAEIGSIIVTKAVTENLDNSKSRKVKSSVNFVKVVVKANDFKRNENNFFVVANSQDLTNSKEVNNVNVSMINMFLENFRSARFRKEQEGVMAALSAQLDGSQSSNCSLPSDTDTPKEHENGVIVENETFATHIQRYLMHIVHLFTSTLSTNKKQRESIRSESTRRENVEEYQNVEEADDDPTESIDCQTVVEGIINNFGFGSTWNVIFLLPKFKGGPAKVQRTNEQRSTDVSEIGDASSLCCQLLQFTFSTVFYGSFCPSRETSYYAANRGTATAPSATRRDTETSGLDSESSKVKTPLVNNYQAAGTRIWLSSTFTMWDDFSMNKAQIFFSSSHSLLFFIASIFAGVLCMYYFEVSKLFSANENAVAFNATFFKIFFQICLFGQLILPHIVDNAYARYTYWLTFVMRYNMVYYVGYSLKNVSNSNTANEYFSDRFISDETVIQRGQNYPLSSIELVLFLLNINTMFSRIKHKFAWCLLAEVACSLILLTATVYGNSFSRLSAQLPISNISLYIYLIMNLATIVPLWSIGYCSYVNFIQVKYVVPYLTVSLELQQKKTREIVQLLMRKSYSLHSGQLCLIKLDSGICAVYIKAADMLSGLIADNDFFHLVQSISQIIDSCVQATGMIKVYQFSGVLVALAPKSSKSHFDLHSMVTYRARLVAFVQMILKRVDDFNNLHNVHVSIGLGATLGDVAFDLWRPGSLRLCASGPRLDEAVKMALYQEDGVYACRQLLKEVTEGKHNEALGRNFKIVEERNWIKLEKYFNGMRLQDFAYVCMLGRGGYGSVHLCSEVVTGNSYAIKVVPRSRKSSALKLLQREISNLQRLYHPNIVHFKYCIVSTSKIYLVLGYCSGGTLSEVIEKDPNVDISRLRFWYAELVLALEYVHIIGLIHRDVKPANCLIHLDGHLKLADFGLSKSNVADLRVGKEETTSNNVLQMLLPAKINIAYDDSFNHDNPYRILLVEFSSFSLTKVALENMLFIVHPVRSTQEAISFLETYSNVDMILVALGTEDVPSNESILLINKICTAPKFREIPSIALWTRDDASVRQLCKDAGAMAFLTLPMHLNYRDVVIELCRAYRVKRDDAGLAKLKNFTLSNPNPSSDLNRKSVNAVDGRPSGLLSNVTISAEDYRNKLSLVRNSSFIDGNDDQKEHSGVGTLNFMAPEIIRSKQYGRAVDWWACGVTFYECAVRGKLFQGVDKEHTIKQITTGPIDLTALVKISPELADLTGGLLVRDPTERLGYSGALPIMEHPFFNGVAWDSISYSNTQYKSAQKINKDWKNGRDLFYEADVEVPSTVDVSREHDSGGLNSSANMSSSSIDRFIKLRKLYKRRRGCSHSHFEQISPLRRMWLSEDLSKRERVKAQPRNSRSGRLHASLDSVSIQEEHSSRGSSKGSSRGSSISKSKSESVTGGDRIAAIIKDN